MRSQYCQKSSCFTVFKLEAIYTGDVSPKILYTHYRVENPGKCWLTLHIAIKEMDKRVYQTFVFSSDIVIL